MATKKGKKATSKSRSIRPSKRKPQKRSAQKGSDRLDPMKTMELSSAYWQSKVIHAANRLDVFTRLDDHPATVDDLARECQADPRGLEILLIACTALGLLRRKNGVYSNSPLSDTFLVKGRPRYQGGIVSMFESWYPNWERLYDAVVTGKPVVEKPHDQGPEALRAYIYGMHYRAIAQGELLAKKIDLSKQRRLIDIAGGPGTFDILFCKAYPNLTATVLDLPQTLEVTREIVASFQMSDRVKTQPGNYLEDASFGEEYDTLLLSSMFNQESPQVIKEIMRKSFNALSSNGLVIAQDQMLTPDKTGPLLSALIGVNQLLHTPGGAAYSSKELSDWLKDVGFVKIKTIPLPPPSPFTVITARKP